MELVHLPERTPPNRMHIDPDDTRLRGHFGGSICRVNKGKAWRLTFTKRGKLIWYKSYPYSTHGRDVVPRDAKEDQRKKSDELGLTRNKCRILSDDTIEMQLSGAGGHTMLFSPESLDRLVPIVWFKSRNYVAGYVDGKMTLCHRFLMNPPESKVIDHINGIGTDNCITNLRQTTYRDNNMNRIASANSITGVLGVTLLDKKGLDYLHVQCQYGGARLEGFIPIARYLTLDDAYTAAKQMRRKFEEELGVLSASVLRPDHVEIPKIHSIPMHKGKDDEATEPKQKFGCLGVKPRYENGKLAYWYVVCIRGDIRREVLVPIRNYTSIQGAFAAARAKRRDLEQELDVPLRRRLVGEEFFQTPQPDPPLYREDLKRKKRKRKRDDDTSEKVGDNDDNEQGEAPEANRATKKQRTLDDMYPQNKA
jgi:hypothetical protein